MWFQAIFGLKINLWKFELVLVGDLSNVEVFVGTLGCKVFKLPMSYLCFPLVSAFKEMVVWNSMLGKIERNSWQVGLEKNVPLQGRPSDANKKHLIQPPNLIPNCHSLEGACCIEKLQRDFLWGVGLNDEYKYHLDSWRCVFEPLQSGGLGIKNLVLFNQALLTAPVFVHSVINLVHS